MLDISYMREEHRLRVSEKRALRIAFGSNRDELIGGLRELYNEQLHNLYYSVNNIRKIKSRKMRLVGYVECMDRKMSVYRVLIGTPEGN